MPELIAAEIKPYSRWVRILGLSILVHVAGALLAGIIVVIKAWPSAEPPPVVVAVPVTASSPVSPETYTLDAGSAAPAPEALAGVNLLASTAVSDFSVPLPPESLSMDSKQLGAGNSLSLGDLAGSLSGNGLGGLGTSGLGTGVGSPIEFFGIQDAGESVVLMIDISGSMFLRLGPKAFERVKQEALELVSVLGMNTRFNIVVWGGAAGAWREGLVPASVPDKKAAVEWIEKSLNADTYRRMDKLTAKTLRDGPGGTRHDLALQMAFGLKPEVIFMISDGNARRGSETMDNQELFDLIHKLQAEREAKARIHSVYFVTGAHKKAERELLERMARLNGGDFREINAKTKDVGACSKLDSD